MSEHKDFYSTSEVAELLGISRVAVFKRIKSGKLKAKKIGRNYIISKESLGLAGAALTTDVKAELDKGVVKTVQEYGETLRLLGKE